MDVKRTCHKFRKKLGPRHGTDFEASSERTFYNRPMRVTVGVSGGIAAYKAAELVRALQRRGIEVHVVMTEAAAHFVQPLTFAALTGHKVITNLWDDSDSNEATY